MCTSPLPLRRQVIVAAPAVADLERPLPEMLPLEMLLPEAAAPAEAVAAALALVVDLRTTMTRVIRESKWRRLLPNRRKPLLQGFPKA